MSKLEFQKMQVASTAHVSKETADLLPRGHSDMESEDDIPSWGPTFAREEGWLFYVGSLSHFEEAPKELFEVVLLAHQQGCQWLMLDRDGETVDNLPTFDW
jgi:hypothetical protein